MISFWNNSRAARNRLADAKCSDDGFARTFIGFHLCASIRDMTACVLPACYWRRARSMRTLKKPLGESSVGNTTTCVAFYAENNPRSRDGGSFRHRISKLGQQAGTGIAGGLVELNLDASTLAAVSTDNETAESLGTSIDGETRSRHWLPLIFDTGGDK